jgi:hypothetical protein
MDPVFDISMQYVIHNYNLHCFIMFIDFDY